MLAKRVLSVLVLLPIGLAAIFLGGWAYLTLVGLLLGVAAWEYVRLFRQMGYQPQTVLVTGGTVALVAARVASNALVQHLLSGLVLLSMAVHLVAYERGRDQAGTDFAITLSGMLYLGWLGGYLITLRALPAGEWWVLTALPAIWLADSGAYFIGKRFGRHRLSPRLSPKKSWEGYLAGVGTGMLLTPLLVLLWQRFGAPIQPWQGMLLALVLGVLAPLGDLGESMLKRQAGVKDSGQLIPGHGGAFDRIDSWLWVGVLAYYLIQWLWI